MKAAPLILNEETYSPCEPEEATHIRLKLPGPLPDRILPVIIKGDRHNTPCWTWNGSIEKPTLKPSILSKVDFGENRESIICHSFVNDGKVQFLSDCSHEFAGQTLDLLDID